MSALSTPGSREIVPTVKDATHFANPLTLTGNEPAVTMSTRLRALAVSAAGTMAGEFAATSSTGFTTAFFGLMLRGPNSRRPLFSLSTLSSAATGVLLLFQCLY